ncbi:M24 family metallopeptidase [Corynebacterium pilosum]|uniref:Xaa-Pro aminopeptidase n=1 Tax=Corynebacterium pilosum TaxID=35756 RepID=A0A376CPI7_9CORY|nr:Xaa-Pro peptidase family protein [Corynebacterium pilosum]STC70436.1 Xaa-Pro aminopeptidase [Corynebacterium pilosum]
MSTRIGSEFPSSTYAGRISAAQEAARDRGLAGVIVGTGPEFAFFTGSWMSSHERLTALTIPAEGTAQVVAPMTDIGDLTLPGIKVRGWRDGEDAHQMAVAPLGAGTVGLGSSLTADHVFALQSRIDDATVLATDALAEVFMVKDAAEIEQLRFAGAAIDRVHAQVPSLLRAGQTESEVAEQIEKLILMEHDVVDFIIVGSGPNGSNPHHSFSDRPLVDGELVVVDLGGTLGAGYHSDCTRTYVVGGTPVLDDEASRAYEVLLKAQEAAVAAVRPGMTAGELDAVARDIIAEAGFGEWFTHRLGHGIGLAGHEAPFIIDGASQVLEEGMVFSIEPGIYKPGSWGMRIEDIVAVTSTGSEPFNFQPKELR